jgi:predicted nucleic acid-binding protein
MKKQKGPSVLNVLKVIIDTNVILDVLAQRAEFFLDSSKILKLSEMDSIKASITASSVTDIVYILKKHKVANPIETVKKLISIVPVSSVTAANISKAFELDFDDFEDALVAAVAKSGKADYIITRNTKDFVKSPVPAITPTELIKILADNMNS